jgi:hypothetical protein
VRCGTAYGAAECANRVHIIWALQPHPKPGFRSVPLLATAGVGLEGGMHRIIKGTGNYSVVGHPPKYSRRFSLFPDYAHRKFLPEKISEFHPREDQISSMERKLFGTVKHMTVYVPLYGGIDA